MTDAELKEIEARAEAATAGPWEADVFSYYAEEAYTPVSIVGPNKAEVLEIDGRHDGAWLRPTDAAFIAHAREDVPALVDEVRALRKALRDLADLFEFQHGADFNALAAARAALGEK